MRYLLDTNIVLRTVNQDDSSYNLVSGVVQGLSSQGDELVLVPQVVYEFWSVASRPARVNGWGWSPQAVRTVIDTFLEEWIFFEDIPEVFDIWLELVTSQDVSGKQVHDARLAAAIQAHDIDSLLTLNGDDFKRFNITSIHPRDVSA